MIPLAHLVSPKRSYYTTCGEISCYLEIRKSQLNSQIYQISNSTAIKMPEELSNHLNINTVLGIENIISE